MLLSELPVFGFVMVKLSVLLAFNAMVLGVKPITTVGGVTTVMLAVAVLPRPPSVELI
jgi:Trk-type K+ transport system membrane component